MLNRNSLASHQRSTLDPGCLLRTLADSGSPAASHKSKHSTAALNYCHGQQFPIRREIHVLESTWGSVESFFPAAAVYSYKRVVQILCHPGKYRQAFHLRRSQIAHTTRACTALLPERVRPDRSPPFFFHQRAPPGALRFANTRCVRPANNAHTRLFRPPSCTSLS